MGITNLKIAAAISALLLGSSAWAGDFQSETTSQGVSYSRSELAAPQGADALYARLDSAARSVCGARSRVLGELLQWQHCRDDALDQAVTQVNDTRLSALHHKGMAPRRMIASSSAADASTGS